MFAGSNIKLFEDGQRLFLTTDERHKFRETIHTLSTQQRLFCRLLYYTGCKINEAVAFLPEHINEQKSSILLGYKGKMLSERYVPIPPAFSIELAIYLKPRNGFMQDPQLSFSRTKGWRLIKDVMNKSGIHGKQATPTGLRHSFAISCLEVTPPIPIERIQKWMGHKSSDLTVSYLEAFQQDEDKSLELLWKHF
ncbi:hypothetical protein BHECKSOX_1653 [Bathymodiolus heckerae thiotrophic gill symbiont]|uniref:tyrosine-type recombinase/integrase n=1 Tax=Bathymodiolus heckerae thiotrophic gill symbiont TaxID=1052212 RepID=UPI0010B02F95|nr:site-specific integrase [Bathymodiolus heckerae thiotrophic gill symbiont]SHN91343.1 hypothetical protein BHECKSOX_1653 [Bathymodiolus heckerae thiotrophic gill symbiont]